MSAITPNFILSPATIETASPAMIDMAPSSSNDLKACWRRALSQVEAFWRDFKTDYLSLLHQRQKWKKPKTNMKEGDLVIIVDDTKKRDMWKLGRVTKTFASDNHVRKVEVKRGDGKIIQRDRSKIVLLEMNDE